MLTIDRRIMGIHIKQIYFPEEEGVLDDVSADIIRITQSTDPRDGLMPVETLQQNLMKNKEDLFMEISKSTRKQIRQAQKDSALQIKFITQPTDEDLLLFQSFYNRAAEIKNTDRCTPFHLGTLKLLRNQEALVITIIQDANQQPLCYRVYAADGKRAMPFYSASHFRLADDRNFKRLVGKAHRMLKWENMLWFKKHGYTIYDSGGLTKDPNVRNFKLEFGGQIITEYSGHLPISNAGRIVLYIRKWKNLNKLKWW